MAKLTRRDFLKIAGAGLAGLLQTSRSSQAAESKFPDAPSLGRVTGGRVELRARPDADSQVLDYLYDDAVVDWLREVPGNNAYRTNQRWVETPNGYVWSPYLQPVKNQPNAPVSRLPSGSAGEGMWVEVTVPWVDLVLDNPPARSPYIEDRLKLNLSPRLYYSQVVWVDQISTDFGGNIVYRVNEKYGTYGDILWGAASAFRPITSEDIAPIHAEAGDKRIVVDVTYQTMACFEGKDEVFFTRISSGALYNASGEKVDVWATPVGTFPIWRKLISLHMSGGTTGGGWDLPGVAWTSLFAGTGVAIHSTFWHNNFGEPMSRGCVNARPEDANWVFRWTQPAVSLDPGDLTTAWPGGTLVEVTEGSGQ